MHRHYLPVAWYIVHIWLKDFAYKTEISPVVFIAAAVFSLTVALLTVSIKSLRTAMRSPVDALRYE
ncbi:MAG TPA: hypothetical protein VE870_08765 [Bacteroidales bacterium]|nr:hypothetical protein [Bacteroidales bacterium]